MNDKLQWESMIWKYAGHLSQRLRAALDDPDTQTVTLDRDDALLTLGIMEGVVEILEKDPSKLS